MIFTNNKTRDASYFTKSCRELHFVRKWIHLFSKNKYFDSAVTVTTTTTPTPSNLPVSFIKTDTNYIRNGFHSAKSIELSVHDGVLKE